MSDNGHDLARVVYYMVIPGLIIYGIIASYSPDSRKRVCEGREGLQVAVSVPAGKTKWRRNVKTSDGVEIPYKEWVKACKVVALPGQEGE